MKVTVLGAALGAAALALSLAAVPAVAQNMQGPGAVNYGAGSSPQTGGIPTTQPSGRNTPAQQGTHGLYNYDNNQTGAGGAPADNNNGNGRHLQ